MCRVAAEEHLIASMKSKTKETDYHPINYYEAYLKHHLDLLDQSGKSFKVNSRFLKQLFYDGWLGLSHTIKESFRNSLN